jgi:hypothetical protein
LLLGESRAVAAGPDAAADDRHAEREQESRSSAVAHGAMPGFWRRRLARRSSERLRQIIAY